jgi:DHA1 family inner membrane transport protein
VTAGISTRTWVGLAVLCLAAGTSVLNNAILSPLLRPIGEAFGTSDAITGQLATLASLLGVGAALAATPWMDHWSRRRWLQWLGTIYLAGIALSALAPSFEWLLLGRVLAGACGSVFMANCMTGARELFPDPVWRNRALGLIVSATTLAFTLGMPLITQIAAVYGWRAALGAMALPMILVLAGTFALPTRSAQLPARMNPLAAFQAILGDRRARALLVVLGLSVGTYTGWLVFFGAYVTEVFAASAGVLSALFFVGGATGLLANNLTPPLLRRVASANVIYATLGAVAVSLLLTGIVVVTVPGALVAAIIVLNGTAAAYIAGTALLLADDVSHPGAAMSLASATIGVGNALGPFVTGWALAATGSFEAAYRTLGLFAPVAMLALWLGTRRRTPTPRMEQMQIGGQ